jgi:dienelactone hydrolase
MDTGMRCRGLMAKALRTAWAPGFLAAVLLGAALNLHAQTQRVMVPSLDRDASGNPVMLIGHWSPAPTANGESAYSAQGRGAMLLLHGCSGPYDASGRLGSRMVGYTEELHRRGWSVLVLDSLTTRGERELCTQRLGTRKVTQVHRRLDAWGGLSWLARQPGVDAKRLGLLGWSNGGSTVLATIEAEGLSRRPSDVPLPAFAVAYYPGCAEALQGGGVAGVPVLLQLGQADDWTPAQTCVNWAQRGNAGRSELATSGGTPVPAHGIEVVVYPGAHHGFDGEGPVRLRRDVPNGVNRGQGVHVGGDPQARQESLNRLTQWLARYE